MHGHEFGMGDHMRFLAKQLNLTDEQQAQMKSIMQKEHPTMKPLMQQQRQIDTQLRQYVEAHSIRRKSRPWRIRRPRFCAQMTVQETRIHSEMYQVLTARLSRPS